MKCPNCLKILESGKNLRCVVCYENVLINDEKNTIALSEQHYGHYNCISKALTDQVKTRLKLMQGKGSFIEKNAIKELLGALK